MRRIQSERNEVCSEECQDGMGTSCLSMYDDTYHVSDLIVGTNNILVSTVRLGISLMLSQYTVFHAQLPPSQV